jgi:hypothetical protein
LLVDTALREQVDGLISRQRSIRDGVAQLQGSWPHVVIHRLHNMSKIEDHRVFVEFTFHERDDDDQIVVRWHFDGMWSPLSVFDS